MSENWAVQVSVKTPAGTLVNVRGEDPFKLKQNLELVADLAGDVTLLEQVLGGVSNLAAGGVTGTSVPQQQYVQPQQAAPAPAPQAEAPQGEPAPMCQHGAMQFRSGSKNGRDWKAYFCPTPKGTPNQCPAQWV